MPWPSRTISSDTRIDARQTDQRPEAFVGVTTQDLRNGGEMSVAHVLAVLKARWAILVGVAALVFGVVAGITWWTPKVYTASASILLDVKNMDPIAGAAPQAMLSPNFLITQVDVLSSTRVSQRVVSNLRLTEVPALQAQWRKNTGGTGSFEGYVAQLIGSGLQARPSRGSNVINVTYESSDPAFAATIVNAYVQAYMDISMEMRTDPAKRYGSFFDASAKEARDKLEQAQRVLSEYQQKQGIVLTDERMDIETSRLSELSQQYVSMQAVLADSDSRRTAAATQANTMQDVMSSPLVSSLKQDVVRAETALAQLQTRLGDSHPNTIELKTNLEDTRRKLEAEVRRVSASIHTNNSINLNRASQIKASLEEQRAKVLKLKQLRDDAAMLQKDVDFAQRTYDSILSRLNLTSLEAQAQQNNIQPLEFAAVPAIPTSPRVMTNLSLGLMGGLFLGALVVALIERMDQRLRTVDQIEVLFQLPHVGSLPTFRLDGARGSSRWLDRVRQMTMPRLKLLNR
ncbi:chain length determinant protein EpsF [Aquabacterium lacunae]|uniref:chain length determinant protein EpsF n=1 Tax=Aquabacterium lacunae TaxID=2528630 RepID=UPI0013EF05F9|nr:chain length determinant protein EpsF [Aquabacterium lacunae]